MNGWRFRLQEEMLWSDNRAGLFVTLTYDEDTLDEWENKGLNAEEIAIKTFRRFLERHRKEYKTSLKHWCCIELGHKNTERLHIHGIFLTTPEHREKLRNGRLKQLWKYGNIYIGDYCNIKTINYIGKYLLKADTGHEGFRPRLLCSPGLGKTYLDREWTKHEYKPKKTEQRVRFSNGQYGAMPTYYRRKRWTDEEREKLRIEQLDANIGYIGKVKYENWNSIQTQTILQEYRKKKRQEDEAIGYKTNTWIRKKFRARHGYEARVMDHREDNGWMYIRRWDRKTTNKRIHARFNRNAPTNLQCLPKTQYAGTALLPSFQGSNASVLNTSKFGITDRHDRPRNTTESRNIDRSIQMGRHNPGTENELLHHKKMTDSTKLYIMLNRIGYTDLGNGLHCPF